MFRYKTIIGRRFHAGILPNQRIEAKVGCNVLNRMSGLGMPVSDRTPRQAGPRGGKPNRQSIRAPSPLERDLSARRDILLLFYIGPAVSNAGVERGRIAMR